MRISKYVLLSISVFFLAFAPGLIAQNNWAWMNGSPTTTNVLPAFGTQGSPSSTTTPGSVFGAVTWTDNAGNLWQFGGYSAAYGLMNDMWKYTISTNQWTWVKGPGIANQYGIYGTLSTPGATNNPGGRYLSVSWTDNSGNFWLFGGAGYASSTYGYMSDLWRYNPSTNQWTWMKGPSTLNTTAVYGTVNISQSTNLPGGRYNATAMKDNSGNLWLFGGYGYVSTTTTVGCLNDLWKYNISSGDWTWMKGSNLLDPTGVYGTATVPSSTAVPGGRHAATGWTDVNGDLWIFGGYGTITTSTLGLANDLWKYTISTGNWTWMRGSNTPNSFGWYGSMGTSASNNDPGARYYTSSCGIDILGNLWLFGGYGYSASSAAYLNDLWKYDIGINQWTWVRGSSTPSQFGIYGTQAVASVSNNPGGRYLHSSWQDNTGKLWIYGGYGRTSTDLGYIGDMWRFDLCNSPVAPANGTSLQNLTVCSGNASTLTAVGGTNTLNWYSSATSTSVLGSGTTFVTPSLSAVGSPSVYTYYVESFSCAASASRTAVNVTVNPTPTLSVNSGTICSGGVFVMLPSGAATFTYSSGSQVVFPTGNSSYTITGTSAQGCAATVPVIAQVTVQPAPVISVNSGSLCTGSSFVMVPSGAVTYSYSGGSATVSPSTSTFYVVTGTSSLGCVSQVPAVSNVLVYNSTPITVNSGAICPGNSFTINPSGALSYTYQGGSAVVSPSSSTTYSVSGTSSIGCVSTAVSTITVNSSPVITVNSGAICSGNSFTITPSGAASYTYSSGSAVVSPTVNSTYFVTGTSSLGCVSAFASISNVTVNALPTISVSNGTICPGTGFTLSPAGALSYTYSSGSAIVSPTITSSYSVTGTNAAGCTATAPAVATVFVSSAPAIAVNSGSVCAGSAFTLSPTGASSYSYQGGSPVVNPSITASYTVTGTNGSGCVSLPATATITVYALPTIAVNSGAMCSGGSFTISPSGASSYTISGGSAVVSPLINSTYSVSGTSSAGCVSSSPAIASVTVNSLPIITVNNGSVCSGNSFTILPSGAATYTYSGGSAIVSPSVNSSYSVTGTSTAGCLSSGVAISTVTVLSRPVIAVNSGSICAGNTFTLVPSGASTYTYSSGSAVVAPTISTTYSVTGTSTAGCVSLAAAVASVAVSTTVTISVNSGSICSGTTFTIVPSGASSYTYSGGSAFVSPGTSSTYTVTGTNTAGCISNPAVSSVAVVASPSLSVNSGAICAGNSFTISPSGASSYTFSSGSAIVNPGTSAVYTVTGSNVSGCISPPVFSSVTVNSLPVISVSSGSICSGNSYSILVSGASSYTYSGGTALVSPTTNSTYSVTGTSSAGCVSSSAAISTVIVNASPVVTVNSGTTCSGSPFILSPSGALSYTFSSGSATVNPLVNSTYSVTGTNSLGCVSAAPAVASVSIVALPLLTLSNGTICQGSSFTLSPTGAVSYTFSSGTALVSPTASSVYSVTGTNAAGCVSGSAAVATVVVNPLPLITVNSGSICSGQTFVLNPSGAVSYTFSGGSATVSPTSNTSYSVSGTSSAGCVSLNSAVSNITVNATPVISAASGTICRGASFTISPSGAASYTYSGASAIVSPTITSSYSVSGTSTAGCISASPAVVNVNVTNTLFITVSGGSVCAGGIFTLTPTGASSYTYSSGSSTVSPAITTTYSVTGTSSLGCLSASPAIATVTVLTLPVVSVNSGSICSGSSFTLNPSGATSYTYSSGSAVVSPTLSTSYSVTGTGTNGCVSSPAPATVTVFSLPSVVVNSGSVCPGGSFTLVPSGAASYTYSGGSSIVTPSLTSTYSITGTSTSGCISSAAAIATVVVMGLPAVTVSNGSICPGASFTFNPAGANSYTYSSGSAVVSPSTTTVYSVNGSSSFGCVSPVVTVTVFVSPLLSISVNSGSVCLGNSFTLSPSGAVSYTYSSGSAVVSPTATTSYSITGSSSGCTNTVTVVANVSVVALPTIAVNSGTICSGDSFTLIPSGAFSYTYSSGSPVVSPTLTTSYSVTGTDLNGCVSGNTAVAAVTVNPLPVISVVSNPTTLCEGETATLTSAGAVNYSWTVNGAPAAGGTSSFTITPTLTSTLNVLGLSAEGCFNSSSLVLTVNNCTGIESRHTTGGIVLYPNPNVGEFVIEVNEAATAIISNELGQVLKLVNLTDKVNKVELNGYANGLYFVKVMQNGLLARQFKVIKN